MHKLPQPVKLWYLSSFFRKEKPQAGRYRQFWQVGAEAIGSDDPAVDAETILLLDTLLGELEVGGVRLRLGSLGTPAARARLPRAARRPTCARTRTSSPTRSARASTSTRCAPSTPTTPAPGRSWQGAPLLLRPARRRRRRALRRRPRAARRAPRSPTSVDPTLVRGLDYYTRTVFEFTSDALGAQSGVGGGGRYDGLVRAARRAGRRPAAAGRPGSSGCCSPRPQPPVAAPPVELYVAFDSPAQRADGLRGRRRGPRRAA